jgi:hypothetical protein
VTSPFLSVETTPEAPSAAAGAPPLKDPNRVAAGKAGAAARKAKQERILAEMREAKSALAAPPPPQLSSEEAPPQSDKGKRTAPTAADLKWTPWIAGVLALAGIYWLSMERPTTAVMQQQRRPPANPSATPAPDLKIKDPFHME